MLRALPKSGAWLNSVKVVMGFLELAAAFKFFRSAELAQTAGAPSIFSYDLVLGLWVALCVLTSLYLIGSYRLPHDSPLENIGVPRLMFSAAFLCLAVYLLPALFKVDAKGQSQRPGGSVYAWIDAFLLPEMTSGAGHAVTGNLPLAIEQANQYQQRTGMKKLIFLDFTGVNCSNCRFNEGSVFSRADIQRLLKPYTVVQLYTDTVPKDFYAPDIQAQIARDLERSVDDAVNVNRAFERAVFDTIELPIYAVLEVRSDPEAAGKSKVHVVGGYDESRIQNPEAFADFLRHPEKWSGKKAGQ
jgi:thiol:disulfide interchange protein DsbD